MSEKFNGINITGLWEKETKNGDMFLSGKIGMANVFIFKNNHKKSERHPDFNMVISQAQRKDKNDGYKKSNDQYDDEPASDDDNETPF